MQKQLSPNRIISLHEQHIRLMSLQPRTKRQPRAPSEGQCPSQIFEELVRLWHDAKGRTHGLQLRRVTKHQEQRKQQKHNKNEDNKTNLNENNNRCNMFSKPQKNNSNSKSSKQQENKQQTKQQQEQQKQQSVQHILETAKTI